MLLVFASGTNGVLDADFSRGVAWGAGDRIKRSGFLQVQLTRESGHGDRGTDAGFEVGRCGEPRDHPLLLEHAPECTDLVSASWRFRPASVEAVDQLWRPRVLLVEQEGHYRELALEGALV